MEFVLPNMQHNYQALENSVLHLPRTQLANSLPDPLLGDRLFRQANKHRPQVAMQLTDVPDRSTKPLHNFVCLPDLLFPTQ